MASNGRIALVVDGTGLNGPLPKWPQNNVAEFVTNLLIYPSHDGRARPAGAALELPGQFG